MCRCVCFITVLADADVGLLLAGTNNRRVLQIFCTMVPLQNLSYRMRPSTRESVSDEVRQVVRARHGRAAGGECQTSGREANWCAACSPQPRG